MFAALLVKLPALVGFTMNFLIQIGAGVMWRLIKKISFLLHLLHWCAKKTLWLNFAVLSQRSKKRHKCLGSSSAALLQDGATASCVSLRLSVHIGEPEQAVRWHSGKGLTRKRGSHLLMLSLSISLHSGCHRHVCVYVCVSMLSGAIGISRKWQNWWSGTTQRRREIAGLNQQTVTVCAYVCEWEWENEWDNVHKNPLVPLAFAVSALSRDRTSHVRFHYGCQFLLHSLNAAFEATAGSFCSNWVRVSLQWLFFLSIFFLSHSFQQLGKSSDALRGIWRLDLQWDHLVTTHWCLQHELFGKINTLF